jgi:hypothetical protein
MRLASAHGGLANQERRCDDWRPRSAGFEQDRSAGLCDRARAQCAQRLRKPHLPGPTLVPFDHLRDDFLSRQPQYPQNKSMSSSQVIIKGLDPPIALPADLSGCRRMMGASICLASTACMAPTRQWRPSLSRILPLHHCCSVASKRSTAPSFASGWFPNSTSTSLRKLAYAGI